MSFIGFGAGGAMGPGSGLRFAQTRGRIQGGVPIQGANYPSPFFDIAHTYLPVTVKQLFKWCRYYFLTNPLINATVFKLSEYPITDIVVEHEDSKVERKWSEYLHDHLRINPFRVEVGLDYHAYGNSCVSIGYPFKKYLFCRNCKFRDAAGKIRANWIFTNFQFRMTCPRCGFIGDATPHDQYYKNASGIKTIRWNPEDIEITYNDITGDYTYFYTIPAVIRNDIVIGRKDVVENIPQVFIQAMRESKGVIFSKDNFFHMRRPTLATQDRGWGTPLLLPVLKDTFYLQIMKKSQEAVLLEHMLPLRTLFPQAGSGSSDPYCVSSDTLVEVVGGLAPASEVRAGDYLRSHTGAWRRVEATKTRPVGVTEKVFQLRVDSLTAFPSTFSEDHPILAVRRTHPNRRDRDRQIWTDPEFIPVKDLRPGDYVAYPTKRARTPLAYLDLADYVDRAATDRFVYRRLGQEAAQIYEWMEENSDPKFKWGERADFLREKGWTEQSYAVAFTMRKEGSIDRMPRRLPLDAHLARLVGYYLAEGYLKDTIPGFALGSDETWIADEIEEAATALGFCSTSRYVREAQHSLAVEVQDVLLGELLVNLCGKGFAQKRVPWELAEADDLLVIEMLRALFAGDGCSFKTETNRVGLHMANPHVILEARRLLLSFGLIGGTIRDVPKPGAITKEVSYHLNYNGEQAEALRVLFTEKKSAIVWSGQGVFHNEHVLLRIAQIDEVSTVREVIGFQMAEDKTFCVAGYATHNTTINLVDWRDQIAAEIARWRHDPNYIPILPLPIGQQSIGGDGRTLLLTQEIQAWSDQILVGMGVPRELLFGGISYSGSNVSLRMLENMFIGYVNRQKQLVHFLVKQIASFLDWPEVKVRFKPFKMADDLQRKAYLFQLNQATKVSDTTLLAESDLAQEEENAIMIRETAQRVEATKKQQLAMAEIQGEQQLVMMKYQAKGQEVMMQAQGAPQAPGEPGGPESQLAGGSPGGEQAAPGTAMAAPGQEAMAALPVAPGPAGQTPQDFLSQVSSQLTGSQRMNGGPNPNLNVDLPSFAMAQARSIAQLSPQQQEAAVQNLQLQSPELASLVKSILSSMNAGGSSAGGGTDMRPLPEQKPPRRANSPI